MLRNIYIYIYIYYNYVIIGKIIIQIPHSFQEYWGKNQPRSQGLSRKTLGTRLGKNLKKPSCFQKAASSNEAIVEIYVSSFSTLNMKILTWTHRKSDCCLFQFQDVLIWIENTPHSRTLYPFKREMWQFVWWILNNFSRKLSWTSVSKLFNTV